MHRAEQDLGRGPSRTQQNLVKLGRIQQNLVELGGIWQNIADCRQIAIGYGKLRSYRWQKQIGVYKVLWGYPVTAKGDIGGTATKVHRVIFFPN